MKTIIKIVCIGFLCILLANQPFFSSAVSQEDSQVSQEQVSAVIPKYFPPLYSLDNKGKPVGFAIDVIEEVAKRAQLKVRYEIKNTWVQVLRTLINGDADLIPNLGITPERQTQISFTTSVDTNPISIFVRASNHQLKTVQDLVGHRVGVVNASVGYELLKDRQDIELEIFDAIEHGLFELLSGRLDALVYNELVLNKIAEQAEVNHRIKIIGEPLIESKRAIAVRKDNPLLLARLNKAIESFIGSEEYKQIYRQWYSRPEQFWTVARLFWLGSGTSSRLMSGLLLLTILVMALWRYFSLRPFNRLKQAETALRASEARYRGIVEDQTELICRYAPGGTLNFVNEAYCRYFQKTPAQLLGKTFFPLIVREDQEKVTQSLELLTQENPIVNVECRIILPSGEIRWHQWTNRVIVDQGGKIIEFQAVGRDITQLKQVEAALRELNEDLEQRVQNRTAELEAEIRERQEIERALIKSQTKYEGLVEQLPSVIYQFSPLRGAIYCSSYITSVIGYSPEYLYEHPWLWHDSIHPQDLPKVNQIIAEFVQGKNFEIEYRIQDAEGKWHWFLDRSIGRQAEDHEIIIEGLALDITEYKETQLALQQAHQRLSLHVENSPLGIIEWDKDYRVRLWSSQAEKIFGWTEEEVLGKTWREWHFVYEEDLASLEANLAQMNNSKQPHHYNSNRNYTKDGSIIDCEWYNSLLYDELGQVVSIMSLVLDISEQQAALRERKGVEKALSLSEERLQLALEGSDQSIWEWNLATGQMYCTPSWMRLLGYDLAEENINIGWWRSKLHPESLSAYEANLKDYLSGKVEYLVLQYQMQTSEGRWLWIEGKGKCIAYDEEGKPLRLIGTHRDITETKEREDRARQQQELLQTIVEQIPVMLVYFDRDYNVLWVNREWEKTLGWNLEDTKNRNILAEFYPDPDYRQYVSNYIQSAQGNWGDFKTRVRDGSIINTSWANVKLSDGTSIGIGQDITERKRIEQVLRDSEQKYRLLFDANPNPLWVFDLETFVFLEVNQAAIKHYGYSREEFLRMTIRDICSCEELSRLEQSFIKYEPQINNIGIWKHRKRNGEIVDVEIIFDTIEFAGRPAKLVLANDVTERLKAQQALEESKERFRRAIVDAPLPIIIHAEDGEIIQVNDTWIELTGYTLEELSTIADWTEKAYGERHEIVRSVIDQLYEIDGKVEEGEFVITIKSGETRIWEFSSAPLGRLPDGRRLVMSMAIDVTERKQAEEQLRHAVLHDGLTGLANRTLLLDRIEQAIKRKHQQPNYLFAILFIDLDRFKVVNDSLGHLVGDELLKAIADKLINWVRPTDTVARFGGDEFVILLENLTIWTEATHIAQRITEELQSSFTLQGQEIFTSVSIGITFSSGQHLNPSELVRNADIAMYRAKKLGRSRYTIFESVMHTEATRLLELEINLRLALEREQFIVYYQPIVSLNTPTLNLIGFEALVRWEHPQKGLISPAEFIPVAEETGLIIPLGEWVLRESCRQMKAWQKGFPKAENLRISVNLSGKQLQQVNLMNCIETILKQTGLKGKNLKLEITESMLMDNKEVVSDLLLEMKKKKIQVSIDDFGTGYSSLSYLHYLPVDTLKIDRSFVTRMNQVGENFEIVEAIITLAHHLQMDVVAEGVETEQHLKQLQQLGCESGQGYFFSKPLDAQKAITWIEKL